MILLSLSFIFLRSPYPDLSILLEQKFHKRSDVVSFFITVSPALRVEADSQFSLSKYVLNE